MRHIDDGFSYEFYTFQQDVIDYYRRKSDYDSEREESEREYGRVLVDFNEDGFDTTWSGGTF